MYDSCTGYNCRSRCGLDDVFGQADAGAAAGDGDGELPQNFLCSGLQCLRHWAGLQWNPHLCLS